LLKLLAGFYYHEIYNYFFNLGDKNNTQGIKWNFLENLKKIVIREPLKTTSKVA
jgi:hypothetical protein